MIAAPRVGPAAADTHRVYSAINRALSIWGIDRRIWMFAAVVGVTAFNMTTSLVAGLSVFFVIYAVVRVATARDPQLLTVVARSATYRRRYDPGKYVPTTILVIEPCNIQRF